MTKILNFLDRDFCLSRRQVLFVALALLIVGFGLRYGYSQMRERQPRDAQFYIQTVESINNNNPDWVKKNGYVSPLMQQIAAFVCRFGVSAETALYTLNMVYAMLWVLVIFFLCRDVFDNNKAGLLGMAIAAFNPYSARMACQILREPLYILIFTLSLWCAVRIVRGRCGNLLYPVAIGVLVILGFFTRIEGVEIIILVPLATVIVFVQYKKLYLRKCVASCAVFFLTIASFIAVLVILNNYYLNEVVVLRLNEYYRLFGGGRL